VHEQQVGHSRVSIWATQRYRTHSPVWALSRVCYSPQFMLTSTWGLDYWRLATRLHELGVINLPVLRVRRQVQRGLRARWPLWKTAWAYGLQLGTGTVTRVTTTTPYVLWLAIVLIGDVRLGMIAMATFALVRATTTMLASARATTIEEATARALLLGRFQNIAHATSGPMLVLIASAFATWAVSTELLP